MAARLAPDVAEAHMRAAQLRPVAPYPGAARPWACVCDLCGRRVEPKLITVKALKGRPGCRWCNGFQVHPDDAAALMRNAGLEPQVPYPGSAVAWPCRCTRCGRPTAPTYGNVRAGSGGCNWCAGKVVDPHTADQAVRAAGWEPLEPYPGSQIPWPLRCQRCGRTSCKRWNDITSGKPGCRYCAQRAVAADDAVSSMRAAGLEPLDPYPGGHAPWRCRCLTCDALVRPNLNTVRSSGSGCAPCGRRRVGDLFRRPAPEAAAALRELGYQPLEPYPGTNQPWRCRHEACGRDVKIVFKALAGRGNGCTHCAISGFKPALPALLYLITNGPLGAHKVGICGQHSRRLDMWRRHGWQVYRTMPFAVGEDAYRVEQSVLRWLRQDRGLVAHLLPVDHGWSETVSADDIDLPEIWRQVAAVAADR